MQVTGRILNAQEIKENQLSLSSIPEKLSKPKKRTCSQLNLNLTIYFSQFRG